jgi:hypothetical protein
MKGLIKPRLTRCDALIAAGRGPTIIFCGRPSDCVEEISERSTLFLGHVGKQANEVL